MLLLTPHFQKNIPTLSYLGVEFIPTLRFLEKRMKIYWLPWNFLTILKYFMSSFLPILGCIDGIKISDIPQEFFGFLSNKLEFYDLNSQITNWKKLIRFRHMRTQKFPVICNWPHSPSLNSFLIFLSLWSYWTCKHELFLQKCFLSYVHQKIQKNPIISIALLIIDTSKNSRKNWSFFVKKLIFHLRWVNFIRPIKMYWSNWLMCLRICTIFVKNG